MSGRPRGALGLLWHNFISSFKVIHQSHKLVGKDMYGTEYYEQVQNKYNTRARPPRHFEPKDGDFQHEIPAEWESWLRYRRKDPPTEEEVHQNYRLAILKKVNADKLDEKYKLLKGSDETLPTQGKQSFPVFEEYKHHGRDYKVKSKKVDKK